MCCASSNLIAEVAFASSPEATTVLFTNTGWVVINLKSNFILRQNYG